MTDYNTEVTNVPICVCGKCIVKRMRNDVLQKFPYGKNLGSTYNLEFDWKSNQKNPDFYNRSKHSGFEGVHREHLPTGLMSTMKFDYKPFKVKSEEKKQQEHKVFSVPFFGRTTNNIMYPSWGTSSSSNNDKTDLPQIKVPFRGNSNYTENYMKHDPMFYKKRDQIVPKATLDFYGRFNPDTTFNTSFRKVDFNQPHYFNHERITKTIVEGKSSFVHANFPKSNFESLYSQAYVDYNDKKCPLADYLNKNGHKYLEI